MAEDPGAVRVEVGILAEDPNIWVILWHMFRLLHVRRTCTATVDLVTMTEDPGAVRVEVGILAKDPNLVEVDRKGTTENQTVHQGRVNECPKIIGHGMTVKSTARIANPPSEACIIIAVEVGEQK
jgi:hypothetical protein